MCVPQKGFKNMPFFFLIQGTSLAVKAALVSCINKIIVFFQSLQGGKKKKKPAVRQSRPHPAPVLT